MWWSGQVTMSGVPCSWCCGSLPFSSRGVERMTELVTRRFMGSGDRFKSLADSEWCGQSSRRIHIWQDGVSSVETWCVKYGAVVFYFKIVYNIDSVIYESNLDLKPWITTDTLLLSDPNGTRSAGFIKKKEFIYVQKRRETEQQKIPYTLPAIKVIFHKKSNTFFFNKGHFITHNIARIQSSLHLASTK